MVSLVSGLGTSSLMTAATSLLLHLPQWLSPRRRHRHHQRLSPWSRPRVQQVALLTQAERLQRAEQARGALVKTWREKAAPDRKGRDFRGIIAAECLSGVGDLMQVGMVYFMVLSMFVCSSKNNLLFLLFLFNDFFSMPHGTLNRNGLRAATCRQ